MTNNKTPSRQEMIDVIYAKISRKDLSFGCKMKSKSYNGVLISIESGDNANIMNVDYYNSISFEYIYDFEIIGHPVMIGDVMDFIYDEEMSKFEHTGIKSFLEELQQLWVLNLREPIEEQSDECISFIFNLINNDKGKI